MLFEIDSKHVQIILALRYTPRRGKCVMTCIEIRIGRFKWDRLRAKAKP